MFFKKNKAPTSVASIVSDLTEKVEQLHELSVNKSQEADELEYKVNDLKDQIYAATVESDKAYRTANKIEALLS